MVQYGLMAVAAYFLWEFKIKGMIEARKTAKDYAADIRAKETAYKVVPKTYPTADYKQWASQLEAAMRGWGTNDNMVKQIFNQMKSERDLFELENEFGVRDGENLREWLIDDGALHYVYAIIDAKKIQYDFS